MTKTTIASLIFGFTGVGFGLGAAFAGGQGRLIPTAQAATPVTCEVQTVTIFHSARDKSFEVNGRPVAAEGLAGASLKVLVCNP